ncbi:hypothetical protein [Anaeromyxobacter oryzae]|uniref:Uncharacterized protein n=1 Tax=Anaeromyxobacter oryzae TaxID=2918170 RepID=A0ABM7WPS5_9BACT|nr:hypothetical protein [Anaeromyxobacter oryzae]BDG01471.1 hypothetical protein AMOR_04670 [Anaeromyxobacter oryzae]
MKLVAIARAVASPDEAARAVADATGLTLAEARMRLAPEPPALLARLEPDEAALLVVALRKAGLAALSVDVRCPTDKDRTVAHSFAFDDAGITFTPRFGDPAVFEWTDVMAILRGLRASRSDVTRTERSKSFSLGAAVATGGLWMTRTSTKTSRSSEETGEQVIFVYARDGRAATLAESQLDFSCLGTGMQPSSTANMAELARRLREKARSAFYDERLMRLGRRPLPFLMSVESRSQTRTVATTRTDTSGSLDTLAEVMRQAVTEALLP